MAKENSTKHDKTNDSYFIRLRKLKENMNLLISIIEENGKGWTTITGECPADYIQLLEQNNMKVTKIDTIVWKVEKV